MTLSPRGPHFRRDAFQAGDLRLWIGQIEGLDKPGQILAFAKRGAAGG